MALVTPTTADIADNIVAQIEAAIGQTVPFLPKTFSRVLAKATAAVVITLYKYAGFMFLQMFVQSASASPTTANGITFVPLTRWGTLIGVGEPLAATQAELTVTVTVENQVGSLPGGSALVNASNGVTYITIGSVLLNAPTVVATIRASADQAGGNGAGIVGNLDIGAVVSFANPLANVARDTVVASVVTVGVDAEPTEVYRQRIIDRFQKLPQGGAYVDYESWGESVAGIVNVYPYSGTLPGVIDVYSECSTTIDPDGIPPPALLSDIADAINFDVSGLASRRPVNAFVNSLPITRTTFDVFVDGLVVDNIAQVQSDIDDGLTAYFLERAPYIIGLSPLPRADRITESGVAGIVNEIVSAAGGVFNSVSLEVGAVPVTIYTLGIGEKAKVGTVTYT